MALVLMRAEEVLGSTFAKNTVLIYLISIIFILQKDFFFYWSKLIYNVVLVSGVPQNESFVAQAGKESACNVGDLGSIPGLERSPGEGKGYLLQYSGLENSMDCIVHGVTKSGHD